nr:MFS transporter [Aneurinibacillus sp. XH2]
MRNMTKPAVMNKPIKLTGALLVIGVILVAANMRASITAVGPLIGTIQADTGLSGALVGMLTTLPLIAFAILSPLAPSITNRFGAENTLFASLITLAVGTVLRSLPNTLTLFTGTLLIGLAIAVCNVLLPALVKQHFANHVGLMTGVYTMSMNLWAALASGISVPMAVGLGLGWRGALVCWAGVTVLAIIVWLPQLRSHRPEVTAKADQNSPLWKSALAWQVTFFMGLQSLLFYVTVTWLPEIVADRGYSATAAGWMLSLMQLCSLPTSFLMPLLAGRRPSQRSFVVLTFCFSAIGYLGLFAGGASLLPLWVAFIGLGGGAYISLALVFIALRTKNPRQTSRLSGMAQCIGYLLAAVGPMLMGWIHDYTLNWTVPLLLLLATVLLLLIFGLGAGRDAYVGLSSDKEHQA